jgi:hypothetical protein
MVKTKSRLLIVCVRGPTHLKARVMRKPKQEFVSFFFREIQYEHSPVCKFMYEHLVHCTHNLSTLASILGRQSIVKSV